MMERERCSLISLANFQVSNCLQMNRYRYFFYKGCLPYEIIFVRQVLYTDCQDVYDAGHIQNGVYVILPPEWPGSSFSVYCNMDNGGGWTVRNFYLSLFLEFLKSL